jgi:nicotinate-nucleotide--dimethylbenzimidazole phosphoribosyltransferase
LAPLRAALDAIRPADATAMAAAHAHLDVLTKPVGSLGRLEELAARLVGIQGAPPHVARKALLIFVADHGVASRGVSAFPAEVTRQMACNFVRGGAAASVLARQAGASLTVIDVGIDGELGSEAGILHAKVRRATRDICVSDALTEQECLQAIVVGLELALARASAGVDCLLVGDMGIGNTTPATAIFCALHGLSPAEVTGRGTGIDDAALARKVDAVERALARHGPRHAPLEILASLGGLEIAAITGVAIAAAASRVPLVIDGFITTAAAAIAMQLHPHVGDFLFFGHRSNERSHAGMLERLEVKPLLDLGMRLGEGTGALLAAHLLDAACRLYREMSTFASGGVSMRS